MRFVVKDLCQGHIYFPRSFSIFNQVTSIHNYNRISVLQQNVILSLHFCQYPIILGKMICLLPSQTFSNILWFDPSGTVHVSDASWYSSLFSQFPLDNFTPLLSSRQFKIWFFTPRDFYFGEPSSLLDYIKSSFMQNFLRFLCFH